MAIDVSPRFTLSLRGYDKEEVDDYLETVTLHTVEADARLGHYEERSRELESEHHRLLARVDELEAAIRQETPHTVRALGERITLILNQAEEGAAETLAQAKARADYLIGEAEDEADRMRRQASLYQAQAHETLAGAQRQAEEVTDRAESEAKAKALGIVTEAENRARRRQDQIEGWAQEVISRTQEDQARMTEEFAEVRRQHETELADLQAQRDDVVVTMRALQHSLGRAIERAVPAPPLSMAAPIELSQTAG